LTAEHPFPRQQSRRGLFAILSIYLHRSALLPRASIGNVAAFALPQVAARRSHSRVPSHRTCNPLPHPHHTAGRLALLATHLSARADFPKKPSRQITTIALATAFFGSRRHADIKRWSPNIAPNKHRSHHRRLNPSPSLPPLSAIRASRFFLSYGICA